MGKVLDKLLEILKVVLEKISVAPEVGGLIIMVIVAAIMVLVTEIVTILALVYLARTYLI